METSKPQKGLGLTFVALEKKGLLKGNSGDTELVRSGDYFIETTDSGNLNYWRLIRKKGTIPDFLIQTKTYPSGGPSSFTDAYQCD